MVIHEDITTFEWWDGDFISEPSGELFRVYSEGKVGPEDFNEEI